MAALANMYRDSFGLNLSSLSSAMGMKAAAGASTKKFTSDDLRVTAGKHARLLFKFADDVYS